LGIVHLLWVHVAPFWPLLPLGPLSGLRLRYNLSRLPSLPKLFAVSVSGTVLVSLMMRIENSVLILPIVSGFSIRTRLRPGRVWPLGFRHQPTRSESVLGLAQTPCMRSQESSLSRTQRSQEMRKLARFRSCPDRQCSSSIPKYCFIVTGMFNALR